MDTLLKNASVITMDGDKVIRNGFVGVTDGIITYVSDKAPEGIAGEMIDCRGGIIMPGLVNAHAHVPMCVMRGYADDYALHEWLFDTVFPAEHRLDARAIVAGARLGIAEMLRTGTTSFSDMYYYEPDIAQLVLDTGVRANLCNAIVALDEARFDVDNDRSMRETRALVADWNGAGDGRIKAEMAIHAEYTSSPRIWEMAADMAMSANVGMQVHVSETSKEHEECIARYGMTPVAVLDKYGVFGVRTTAAHCVWVTENDMDMLAARGVTAVHCPVSNLKLASGIARTALMRAHGVNVALGTDGCCSNNTHDLFEEIKLSALLAKGISGDPTALAASDVLKMATVGGARAQGRDDIGIIREGMAADIIALDTNGVSAQPVYEPCGTAVYSLTGREVFLTMVNGRILYRDGEFMTIDVEKAIAEVNSYAVPIVRNDI